MKFVRNIAVVINVILIAISIRAIYLTFVVEMSEDIKLGQKIGFSILGTLAFISLIQIVKRIKYFGWPVVVLNGLALILATTSIVFALSSELTPANMFILSAMVIFGVGNILNIVAIKIIPIKAIKINAKFSG